LINLSFALLHNPLSCSDLTSNYIHFSLRDKNCHLAYGAQAWLRGQRFVMSFFTQRMDTKYIRFNGALLLSLWDFPLLNGLNGWKESELKEKDA
jgi:hypothetical protein